MSLFARYFVGDKLVEVSMDKLAEMIQDEQNKAEIADLIYQRYYTRYLKIFFYQDSRRRDYSIGDNQINKSVFDVEYKNGFSIMANCCLLIETMTSFFDGVNETPKGRGPDAFKKFFLHAEEYGNELKVFAKKSEFYYAIRCGLLHQGETKKQFKIRRFGELFDEPNMTINATTFCFHLKKFLISYKEDLSRTNTKWDSDRWDKCRLKLRYIISNGN